MAKKKFYGVKVGSNPGVYETWEECEKQIKGYSGAVYKSFATREESENFVYGTTTSVTTSLSNTQSEAKAYVDGSYDNSKKLFSYGVVFFYQEQQECYKESFDAPHLVSMRNVSGEIKGAEKAMQLCLDRGISSLDLFYDYEGVEKWCTGEWSATKVGTQAYAHFYQSISSKLQVIFHKVAAHSGDQYNDMADRLAKEALGLITDCKPEVPTTLAEKEQIETPPYQTFRNLTSDWQQKLLEHLSSLGGVEKTNSNDTHHKFKSSPGDTLTVGIFSNGTVTIQGKPLHLYGEALYFLSLSEDVTDEDVVNAISSQQEISVEITHVRNTLQELLPNSYSNIDDTILKIISSSVALLQVEVELEDYTVFAFPALRALEGYLKFLLSEKNIQVGNSFGDAFHGDTLQEGHVASLGNAVYQTELERIYVYFKAKRHILFHVDSYLEATALVETKEEANQIVNDVLNLIENSYNNINP